MFNQDRTQLRQFFLNCWTKHQNKEHLEPLEMLVVGIIEEHPEYHGELNTDNLDKDYSPDSGNTNPFLHMSLHISLKEQISTDMPRGINAIAQQLLSKLDNQHSVEHQMMECLGQILWESQKNNQTPDEQTYLRLLQNLI